jgi:methyl-accepting chemotaxis protein
VTDQGGTEWELREAENAIVAAGNDPVALAQAQRRHAEAIRNMMQGAIVPMFVTMVERSLDARLLPIARNVEELGAGQQRLQAGFHDLSGGVLALGESVDELRARFTEVEATVDKLRIAQARMEARQARQDAEQDRQRHIIEALAADIEALKAGGG